MVRPEGAPLDEQLDPESPTADVVQDADEEAAASDYQEAAEEAVTSDYQERMEEFEKTDASVPLVSLPRETGDPEEGNVGT